MALTHLVDTSVLTRLNEPFVRAALERLTTSGDVARAGISDLEVGFSARTAKDSFALVETDASHVRRARQVQRLLAARSQRGRKIPDLLVAAAAEDAGLAVLHYNADFDHIAAVTSQACEWVVPAGSIA